MSPAAVISTPPPSSHSKSPPIKSSAKPIITPSTTTTTTTSLPPALPPSTSSQIPAWVQPDLTRLLRVEHRPGTFTSRALSLISLPPGSLFARITTATPAPTPSYTTVQASRHLHISLNSDLVYINHSCRPTLIFDMQAWEIRVCEDLPGGLKVGDELTFFYPSTEWDMSRGFECECGVGEGEGGCRGWIKGAGGMGREVLGGYWLSGHIREMLGERDREREREREQSSSRGSTT